MLHIYLIVVRKSRVNLELIGLMDQFIQDTILLVKTCNPRYTNGTLMILFGLLLRRSISNGAEAS